MKSSYLDVVRLKRFVDSVYNDALSKFHVNLVEAHIIAALAERGPLRPMDLAHDVQYPQTSFTPVLDHLQELNLITRAANTADRRSILIALTEEGAALAALLTNVLQGADVIVQGAFATKQHIAHEFVEKYARVPY